MVAAQHHPDNILADVVHVALDGGHQHLFLPASFTAPGLLLPFDMRYEDRHRLLHDARALDHLRQEHLAVAKQVADHVHAIHQRAFDHVQRPRGRLSRLFSILFDVAVDAFDQRMLEALVDRQLAPGLAAVRGFPGALVPLRNLQQALGGIRPAVEHHVLHRAA